MDASSACCGRNGYMDISSSRHYLSGSNVRKTGGLERLSLRNPNEREVQEASQGRRWSCGGRKSRISPASNTLDRFPRPPTDSFDGRKTNPKEYSTFKSSDNSDVYHYEDRTLDWSSHPHSHHHHCPTTTERYTRTSIVPGLKFLVLVSELYRTAVDYRSYKLIRKYKWFDVDVAFRMQRMEK